MTAQGDGPIRNLLLIWIRAYRRRGRCEWCGGAPAVETCSVCATLLCADHLATCLYCCQPLCFWHESVIHHRCKRLQACSLAAYIHWVTSDVEGVYVFLYANVFFQKNMSSSMLRLLLQPPLCLVRRSGESCKCKLFAAHLYYRVQCYFAMAWASIPKSGHGVWRLSCFGA